MKDSNFDISISTPTARGIASAVTAAVRDGLLVPGDRLPSIRSVAERYSISPTTVSSAWAILLREGVIDTNGPRGTTIAARSGQRFQKAFSRQARIQLDASIGLPDPAFVPDVHRALSKLSSRTNLDPLESFRTESILSDLEAVLRESWPYEPEKLTMLNGTMDALEVLLRLDVGRGSHVVVENPCFPPILDLLDEYHIRVTAVPMDDEGLDASLLAEALGTRTAAVVLQPVGHNPTGISMSEGRAKELARVLEQSEVLIFEDATCGAVCSGPSVSMGTWLPKQTVHVRGYSKSHGPEVRLAALGGPAEVIDRVVAHRQRLVGWTSRILQELLLTLLTDDASRAVLSTARERYQVRRRMVSDELAARGIAIDGSDGYNIWLPVADETAAVLYAARNDIGVAPGTPFMPIPGDPHVRITASSFHESEIPRISAVLADAARAQPLVRA